MEIGGWRRPFDIFPTFPNAHSKAQELAYTLSFTPPPQKVSIKGENPNKKVRRQDTVCVCHFLNSRKFSKYALQTNFHGRISTSVKWLSPGHLAITCGEDGKVKVMACYKSKNVASTEQLDVWHDPSYEYERDNGSCGGTYVLECIKSLEMHRTSIRALATACSSLKNHTLVISAGGNNIICCWRIATTEAVTVNPSVALLSRKCYAADDGEHRFLSIATSRRRSGMEIPMVFAGNSQGHIYCFHLHENRAWDFSTNKTPQKKNYQSDEAMDTPVLSRVSQNISHSDPRKDSPILSLGCITDEARKMTIVIAGGANGILTLWKVDDTPSFHYKSLYDNRLHQCGINCLDHSEAVGHNDCFTVVSGGDDTAFCIAIFKIFSKKSSEEENIHTIKAMQFVRSDSFCASALSGIRIVDDFVFCAGWNQRLHVLHLDLSPKEEGGNVLVKVKYVASCFLDVPDLSDLDVVRTPLGSGELQKMEYRIISVGQGVQVASFM